MAARSIDITFHNETGLTLTKTGENIDAGEWTSEPPNGIPAGATVSWRLESGGIATGTEGNVTYDLDSPWNSWFQIHSETVFDHNTQQLTAIARVPGHIDLFVIGFDNAVWSSWWEANGGWRPWFQIHAERVFDHTKQKITALARTSNHIDLFVIGFDNAVWSCWWEGDATGWRPWFQIHPETVFDCTAQRISALARTSGHVDLFVIGFDNAVWSSWWEGDAIGWRPWFQIHHETVFDHTTQKITALSRTQAHVDLFVIGFDNVIWSSWWEGDAIGWRPWFQIHPERVFDHTKQKITALARTSGHVDLFVIGFDNAVWSCWWEGDAAGWRPWFQIHPDRVFDYTAQQITAVARTQTHVDLFVIGFDNAVWSCWWEGDATGWRPWFQIHPETVFDRTRQQIAALTRDQDHVDLFTVGFDNVIWSAAWGLNSMYLHFNNPFAGNNKYDQNITGPCGLYFSGGKGNNTNLDYYLIPDQKVTLQGYLPSKQGFAFANSWPSMHITSITLPDPFGDILVGNAAWGLCGGMSFASRDYFEAKQLAPAQTTNPTGEGDPLFDYIVRRLAQSLNTGDAADFVKFADPAYPDTDDPTLGDGRNWQMARVAWPGIRNVISSGHPCPIGIVIGYLPNVTSLGHQVCVYAYQLQQQMLTLWVYDCNSPRNDSITIILDISQTSDQLINVQSRVNVPHSIVCFFTQSYEERDTVDGRPE
jgi:hypothetical protein